MFSRFNKVNNMIIPELKKYPLRYRKIGGYKYYFPRRGESLIPPRILLLIFGTGNTLDWKAKTLSEKERYYEKVIRCKRRYPVWKVCECELELVFIEKSSQLKKRCEFCAHSRISAGSYSAGNSQIKTKNTKTLDKI